MVQMMILHVFRMYLIGGFKKSHELTWVTGVIQPGEGARFLLVERQDKVRYVCFGKDISRCPPQIRPLVEFQLHFRRLLLQHNFCIATYFCVSSFTYKIL